MGCSGYRIKYGTSDEAIVNAIREHATKSMAETEGSPWIGASSLTDEQLLGQPSRVLLDSFAAGDSVICVMSPPEPGPCPR
jgi:hypothetical protein